MRIPRPIAALLLATCILLSFGYSEPVSSQAVGTAMTIGSFIHGLEELAKTLENSAHSLLEQGNNVAAQQQLIMAGTIRGAITQLSEAYRFSMNKTLDRLDKSQSDAFKNLALTLRDASRLENRTSKDLNSLVDRTQSSANQLIDRIPLTDKSPIYFGIQTRDVLSSFDAHPDDIVIRGYHLVDPRLGNQKPRIEISVAGKSTIIPADNIAAQFDRINVHLPDALRDAIRIDNQPCRPMRLFHLGGTTYYKGGWFNTSRSFGFNADISPGDRLYEIKVITDGEETTTSKEQATFSNASGQINLGCQETQSTTVSWTVPHGAEQLNAQSEWINTDNIKSHSQNAVANGDIASATGSITGLDKRCVPLGFTQACDCPGGGHGSLRIFGSYVITQPVTKAFHDEKSVVHVGPTHVTTPSGSIVKTKRVHIAVTRKGCAQIIDSIDIDVPEDQRIVQATSSKGYFEAVVHPGQVDIDNTKLIPDGGDQ